MSSRRKPGYFFVIPTLKQVQGKLRRESTVVLSSRRKHGYFVYRNGKTDRAAFDAKLEFDISLVPYKGDDGWVEKALRDAHKCLCGAKIPKADVDCDYCNYIEAVNGK